MSMGEPDPDGVEDGVGESTAIGVGCLDVCRLIGIDPVVGVGADRIIEGGTSRSAGGSGVAIEGSEVAADFFLGFRGERRRR